MTMIPAFGCLKQVHLPFSDGRIVSTGKSSRKDLPHPMQPSSIRKLSRNSHASNLYPEQFEHERCPSGRVVTSIPLPNTSDVARGKVISLTRRRLFGISRLR